MDLVQGLRSKNARYNSWRVIYREIVSKIDKVHDTKKKKEKKDVDHTEQPVDWYEKCMNKNIRKKLLPTLKTRLGTKLTFEVGDQGDDFFDQNIERYIRMVVMATLYNVTCDSKQSLYVSHYDHDTDIITAYPIEELLMASFYGLEINGILFLNRLSKEVLHTTYDEPVTDVECQAKMFTDMDYSKLFKIPYDPDQADDYDENYDASRDTDSDIDNDTEISKSSKSTKSSKSSKSTDDSNDDGKKKVTKKKMLQYPCCRYAIDLSGRVMEVCTEDTGKGAHHCFGCESDFVKTIKLTDVPVHQQMFDFNNFIISIKKTKDDEYDVEFNDRQNPPYKHASYTDMGRGKVVTHVTETISKASWVTSMKVKIEKQKDSHILVVKHVGIDWF